MSFGAPLSFALLFNVYALAAENAPNQTSQKPNTQQQNQKQKKQSQEQKKKLSKPAKKNSSSLKIFKPRESISADNSASFPNDIWVY